MERKGERMREIALERIFDFCKNRRTAKCALYILLYIAKAVCYNNKKQREVWV